MTQTLEKPGHIPQPYIDEQVEDVREWQQDPRDDVDATEIT